VSNGTAWLYHILNANSNTALIIEKLKGYPGRLSRVIINPEYKEQIMQELLDTEPTRLTDRERKELDRTANRFIPINTTSLSSYIEQTKLSLTSARGTYRDKLTTYLILAQDILVNADENMHKEYWETADTGREYGHYNSLQRMPSIVRHAALGHCHRYDFQAHSFAVLASFAHAINPNLKIASVIDYVKNRSQIRKRIANQVGVHEDAIKEVFTSLGFGAQPINNPFKAIRRAVYNEDNYNKLIATTEFQYIYEDLELIRTTILADELFQGDFELLLNLKFNEKKENTRKKTPSQRLAWIYQNTEAYITRKFIDLVREYTGFEPLLTVHDGVYYRQPIPNETMLDVQMILREQFQYVRVEYESIWPVTTDEHFNSRFQADEDDIVEHKQRIAQEEQLARGYKSDFISSANTVRPRRVTIDPDAIETQAVGHYNGSDHQARAWYGDENYDQDTDPFLADMSREQRREYQLARDAVVGPRPDPTRPDFVQQLLERN
jgi:hypothetical protein